MSDNTTDRELLELAAKAAGIDLVWNDAECPGYYSDWHGLPQWEYWNPLVSDGVALRLAVKLAIEVHLCSVAFQPNRNTFRVRARFDGPGDRWFAEEYGEYIRHNVDPYAATRRAIVRAAAEIGRAA